MKIIVFCNIILLCFFIGCQSTTADTVENGIKKTPKYAKNFDLEIFEDYKILTVKNAWEGVQTNFKYIIHPKEVVPPTVKDAVYIPTPVTSIACLSTTHVALLKALHADSLISGIAGASFIFDTDVFENVNQGTIKELGNESGVNYETLIELAPDIVLTYGISGNVDNISKLKSLGLRPVVMAEYTDVSPLARAEWIQFLAVILGKEDLATNTFQTLETEYKRLQTLVKDEKKPTVFTGTTYQGTWFMPAGKSFVATYITDAGGEYLWADNQSTRSSELAFEVVYEKANAADKWLDVGIVHSLAAMKAADSRYEKFEAFQKGEVYNYNARVSINGGFDIYESAVVRPDVVLKDFIKILHPNLLPDYELFYYKKIGY